VNASPTHLLHRALQLALDFHADAAGPSALTQRQFTVLAAASHAEGLTQNDLVRATGIDRSTLADLVARLLAKGLLLRERSATDGRANTVRLSDAGRQALAEGAGAAATADLRLLALLSPKKRDGFMKTLASLAAAADAPPPAKEVKAAKTIKAAKVDKADKSGKADRTKKKRHKGAKKAKAAAPHGEAAA
jgi:DNA-binding MarR family transcriptional regulator